MQRSVLTALVSLCLVGPAFTQELRDLTVSAETRLDWAFASAEFGAGAQKLAKDFDPRTVRYQLFVPREYDAGKTWPLVVFISPGDGPAGWSNFRKACSERGMLFCSPYKAGNSCPAGQRTHIVLDMVDDVRRQYRIDPERTYLAGFSGGGRMACSIGYALPEYFAGIIPICGTNPPPRVTYLRHRLQARCSVAFVTGETDFNRKENEIYMQPYVDELGIRTKLWVVPKLGHGIPSAEVMDEIVGWLEADVKRRRADAAAWPGLAASADKTPTADEQAAGLLASANTALKNADHVWRGVALLQGTIARWPKSTNGVAARQLLQKVASDAELLKHVEAQGSRDEQRFLVAQAKSLERFGLNSKAIEAWQILAEAYPGTEIGQMAEAAMQRLRKR